MKNAVVSLLIFSISNILVISSSFSASAFAADKTKSTKCFSLKDAKPNNKKGNYLHSLVAAVPKDDIILVESKIYLRKASYKSIVREVLSGYIVALSTLPASAAYGTLLGISPLLGIWSSVIVGLTIPLLAGGPGIISGAAGVIAIPISKLLHQHEDINYMSASILLASVLEICFSLLRLGKLGHYVTEPVIVGFMNAFALFLLNVQTKFFMVSPSTWLPQSQMVPSLAISGLCMLMIHVAPLITKALPSSLIALIVSSFCAIAFKFDIKTLADITGSDIFQGGLRALPSFTGLPQLPVTWDTLAIILPTSITIMTISIIETVLADKIKCQGMEDMNIARLARKHLAKHTTNHSSASSNSNDRSSSSSGSSSRSANFNQQQIHDDADDDYDENMIFDCPVDASETSRLVDRTTLALGIGNALSALFGGFGGCPLIPNTILNGRSGGYTYISSVAYALSLALSVVLLAPWIGKIPIAALAGLMINLGLTNIDVKSISGLMNKAFHKQGSLTDRLNLLSFLVTTVLCFQVDMAVGVFVGTAISQMQNIVKWTQSKMSR